MRLEIAITILLFFSMCKRKDINSYEKVDKIESAYYKWSSNLKYDTIYKYQFINMPIYKKLDKNIYSNMLIMEGRGRTLLDTVGYFRIENQNLYCLSIDYKRLQEKSKETKYPYKNMHQQLFFNFDMHLKSTIEVYADSPFGVCTFILLKKMYSKKYNDTIFVCERTDSSLPYQSDGGYHLKFMKLGKKVGFTELIFLNVDKNKYDVYLPNGSYTWKIISKDTLIYPSNLRP